MSGELANLFSGGESKGAQKAGRTLAGEGSQIGSQYSPWITAGRNALGKYQSALGGMSDPQDFYRRMMAGYHESGAAKEAIKQGIHAADAAGAASGMLGSGAEKTALQRQGQRITDEDQQNWLNNMRDIYGQYVSGEGSLQGEGFGGVESQAGLQAKLAEGEAKYQERGEEGRQRGKGGAIGTGLEAGGAAAEHFGWI